jgi:hypothetical protein
MTNTSNTIEFYSPLAPVIKQFIQEKRACGYQYNEAPKILNHFDRFLCQTTLREMALPEELVLHWLEKYPKEHKLQPISAALA